MNRDTLLFPTVALRGITILPGSMGFFDVSRTASKKAVDQVMNTDKQIFLVTQKSVSVDNPKEADLYSIGTLAKIRQTMKMKNGMVRVLAEGISRGKIEKIDFAGEYLESQVYILPDYDASDMDEAEEMGLIRALQETFTAYANATKIGSDLRGQVMGQNSLVSLMTLMAAKLPFSYEQKQRLLEAENIENAYAELQGILTTETKVILIKEDIHKQVKEKLDENQRDYVLREELKVITEELKDSDGYDEFTEYSDRIEGLNADDKVKEKLNKELKRLEHTSHSSSEAAVLRNYLDACLELPWNNKTEDVLDLKEAEKILNKDHYGLEKVKERVIEFLAVHALTGSSDAQIICLVGPPGTGKTSIAKSIAKSLNREYVRICLGGVRDESEIRGHRKTYVGAMPGRIIEGLKAAGVSNPVMLLDEIDKVSKDYKGDTSSALLEVLDPEQNSGFRDHYIEIPVDLSKAFFIATANATDDIPRPLLDRMEIINIPGYTENEKFHIAKEHLVKKQLVKNGIKKSQCSISDAALKEIIRSYTREAGVRNLERQIATVYRKTAKMILMEEAETVKVSPKNITDFLGKKRYFRDSKNEKASVGIVRGLAWTRVGGDTLEIEVNVLPGKGELKLTGQMGDVMKESAQIALGFVRSQAADYGIDKDYFAERDILIHIPEGAVPKDGPSAGITMSIGIFSAVTGKKVRPDVAMTGEITLRGRVLPIGGLKEKLLAAKDAGMKTVLVPVKNKPDVEELSEEITGGLEIVFVSDFNEAKDIALIK